MTPYRLWGNHINSSGITPGTPEWYVSQNKAATNSVNRNKSFSFFIVTNTGPGEVWFAKSHSHSCNPGNYKLHLTLPK